MGKRADIQPLWLVKMMEAWARKEIASTLGVLGYPKKAIGFSEKTTGGYNHTDPFAYTFQDFRSLDTALEHCRLNELALWATMMMYYKPWVTQAFRDEGYSFADSTYYKRLHRAHRYVALFIEVPKQLKSIAEIEAVE